ncbi:MAG TPA: hypothetical protein VK655_12015 [Solirubrobacteraceae bacterium]|jgi:hypothetical protein|nr:hypothetical protein [Solirubrobacteraceae bacterium]
MLTDPAASLFEVVLAIHIIAVVVAFGVTFAYPIMFTVAARQDPRGLPLMHRIEYTTERYLLNPGLLVVLAAGIYLASKGHFWSDFFVQWGLAAVVVIGASVGAVMIPTSKRAEQIATRDLAASLEHVGVAGAGAGAAGEIELSDEYRALVRRLSLVGTLLSVLVLVTIVLMALHVGA